MADPGWGLVGMSETDTLTGFCERCVAAELPLDRALVLIDTLHPVHEGRVLRWGYAPTEPALVEYGRTSPAIHEHGGDVLKLIGDGTLAIFTAEDRTHACGAALSAAVAAREGIVELNRRRLSGGKPVTDMYLGLHVGEVFYGNVGSRERLDFTVVGPAVNEASRIAAMCRSVDIKRRLISVGRYALRGVSQPQELFTIDPTA